MTPVTSPRHANANRSAQPSPAASPSVPTLQPALEVQPAPEVKPRAAFNRYAGKRRPTALSPFAIRVDAQPLHPSFSALTLVDDQSPATNDASGKAFFQHPPARTRRGNSRPLPKQSMAADAARNEAASSSLPADLSLSTPSSPQFEGKNFLVANGYSDFKECGNGAAATVFTARLDDKTVCVKVNNNDAITDEFRAMEACNSPRLCKPIMHNAEQAPHILVMEFSNGMMLEDDKAKEKFRSATPERQLLWVKKAVSALDQLHSSSYTHNDISAGNILLTDAENGDIDLQVIDFGKASALDLRPRLGTPIYISPRTFTTISKNRNAEIRTQNDLYALGICVATFYGDWKDIKVGEQKMSDFKTPVQLQRAYKTNQTANVDGMGIPPYLREVVDKLLTLGTGENAGTVTAMIDQSVERGRMAAHDRR